MGKYKEYRVYGRYGMWGDIHTRLETAELDLAYCNQHYADSIASGEERFELQERDVTDWVECVSGEAREILSRAAQSPTVQRHI